MIDLLMTYVLTLLPIKNGRNKIIYVLKLADQYKNESSKQFSANFS